MDAYEVHKKVQETITLVDVYQTLSVRSSRWHSAIKKGLKELSEKGQNPFAPYMRFVLRAQDQVG